MSTHRQPLVLTARGRAVKDFLICLACIVGLGVFGALVIAAWFGLL